MFNLIQADLFKLRKSMAIKILFSMTAAGAIIMATIAYLIPLGKVETRMTGLGFMFSDINMISILGGVIAAIIVCGDFENKTIHDAIASGSSRAAVIVSKTAVLALALTIILLPYVLVASIALGTGAEFSMESVATGFLHILTTEGGSVFSSSEAWKLAAASLVLILVYIAQLSICVPLAFVLKKPIFVVAIYYGFSILCGQLMSIKGSSPVFDRLFSLTPYGGNHVFMSLNTGTGDLIKTLPVSFIFILIVLAVTYSLFRKTEIK